MGLWDGILYSKSPGSQQSDWLLGTLCGALEPEEGDLALKMWRRPLGFPEAEQL